MNQIKIDSFIENRNLFNRIIINIVKWNVSKFQTDLI